jgi:hypothetical protein
MLSFIIAGVSVNNLFVYSIINPANLVYTLLHLFVIAVCLYAIVYIVKQIIGSPSTSEKHENLLYIKYRR